MRHALRYFAAAAGIGVIAIAMSLTATGQAVAQGAMKPIDALIVNTTARPVPVTVLGTDRRINACGESQAGNPTKLLFEVPVDKRLEIDFASMRAARFLVDNESLQVIASTTVDGVEGEFLIGEVRGAATLHDSRAVRLYADAGSTVTVSQASKSFAEGGHLNTANVCITGRLLPL